MKNFTIFIVFLFWVNGLLASPLINHVDDDLTTFDDTMKNPRWVMVPDTTGKMYLVDLHAYVPQERLFVPEADMKFVLSTRKAKGEVITLNTDSINASSFDRNHPTRITIHGWNGDHTSDVNDKVIEEYLNYGDHNCIMVDWSKGAGTIDYIAARYRIDSVAVFTAKLIDFLEENGFIDLKFLHIIGHSLGAHAAGLAGRYVSRGRVEAIYGLDPAGPLFWNNEPEGRITSTDGNYVEIMHTAGYSLGYGDRLGQADFYPNFGRSQPGCILDVTGSCAHLRAPMYFAESINSQSFVAERCESLAEIKKDRCTNQSPGEVYFMRPDSLNHQLNGVFYLKTNSKSLFALGHRNTFLDLVEVHDVTN